MEVSVVPGQISYFWINRFFLFFHNLLDSCKLHFSSVQSLSPVWLSATPWTAARQASLSITNSQSLLKLMSIELVMPSNHLTLCCTLLLLPSIFPNITVFSNKSVLHIRWPKYWSFNFSISHSDEYSGSISFRMDWLDLLAVQVTLKSLPTPQFKTVILVLATKLTENFFLVFKKKKKTRDKIFQV